MDYARALGYDNETGEKGVQEEDTDFSNRLYTRAASDPLLCYTGQIEQLEGKEQLMIRSLAGQDMSNPETLTLISGLHHKSLEKHLASSLDMICPELRSSPSLQSKALRIVFSVGVDIVIVDADASAMMGKLSISPSDILASDSTDRIFGSFFLPRRAVQ